MTGSTRAVCFDLDGCLVDSRHAISTAINHALAAIGLPTRPVEALYGFIGPPLLETFRQCLVEEGRDLGLAQDAIRAYRSVYPELAMTQTPVFDGILDVLGTLRDRQVAMAVVTSKPRAYAEPIVEAVGLRQFFTDVFGPELHAIEEPKAVKLRTALESLGMDQQPRSVAMVGDRRHDVDAARVCGTTSIGVLWGIGDAAELTAAGADHLVDAPKQIADLIPQPPM